MPRFLTGGTVALVLLLILVVTAPARVIRPFLPEQLLLQGLSGTLWQGQASRALVAVPGGHLHLGRLSWSLSPLSLLVLAPRLALDGEWGEQRFRGEFVYHSPESMEIAEVNAVVPAALVRQFVPLELTGSFSLLIPRLVVDGGVPVEGSGRVVWQNGGWVSPQGERSLGSYAVDFAQPEGSALVGEVVTISGELRAAGSASLEGREYGIDVLLSGRGLDDPQLRQALQLVAIPEGEDFRVKLQGSL